MVHGVAGGALAAATATGGHANAITLGTTAGPIIGTNGGRQNIVFMNPGSSTVYVGPALTATGTPFSPSLANPAGTFMIVSGGALSLSGEVQCAWQGFSATSGNPLTVLESNI
jgi:hypothetical protein